MQGKEKAVLLSHPLQAVKLQMLRPPMRKGGPPSHLPMQRALPRPTLRRAAHPKKAEQSPRSNVRDCVPQRQEAVRETALDVAFQVPRSGVRDRLSQRQEVVAETVFVAALQVSVEDGELAS